jgi:hypothetical protein
MGPTFVRVDRAKQGDDVPFFIDAGYRPAAQPSKKPVEGSSDRRMIGA